MHLAPTARGVVFFLAAATLFACKRDGGAAPVDAAPPPLPIASGVALPAARNGTEIVTIPPLPPVVAINAAEVLVDGEKVAGVPELAAMKRLHRIDDLFNRLKARRAVWKEQHPGREFPGLVLIEADAAARMLVVKDVFQTSAFAGYPDLAFVVRTAKGGVARLVVSAYVPLPGWNEADDLKIRIKQLHVEVKAEGPFVLSWRESPAVLSTFEAPRGSDPRFPELAARIGAEWNASGEHRDAGDRRRDSLVVHSEDELPFEVVAAVIDAALETKRGDAPAFDVILVLN